MGGKVGGCPPCVFISKRQSFRGYGAPETRVVFGGGSSGGMSACDSESSARLEVQSVVADSSSGARELLFSFAECTRETVLHAKSSMGSFCQKQPT